MSVDNDDKYTAAIEVSNACRMFYVSRLQTAETLKDRLVDRRRAVRQAAASSQPRGPDAVDDTAALESVVAQLHNELASLIDIDLQVMRQLLMLNDQVEEMKWQRRQLQQHRRTLMSSACATPSIDDTDCSDTERPWSRSVNTPDSWSLLPFRRPVRDDDDEEATLKYPTPSALSLLRAGTAHDDERFSDSGSVDALDRPNPDTPDVFPTTPQTDVGSRTTAERHSPPKKPTISEDKDMPVCKSTTTDQHNSTIDIDQKLPRSLTKTKEQELHSTNNDSLQDFCTYVEMLI